jgi:riboflavin synthase
MFTGIVEKVGKVLSLEEKRGQKIVVIQTGWKDLELGESIAVNGVCLTVTECGPTGDARFFISEESLERSNLNKIEASSPLNLERAITIEKRFSGHLVQGHVDTTATLINITAGADHHKLTFAIDPKFGRYCVEKGSITFNGISLTINTQTATKAGEFMVSVLVIPHTWKHTNLSQLAVGDQVNLEVDVIAKYVERLCQQFLPPLNN